ncbi:MAG: glycosyltransferase family 4 protein [Chloroflexaceae bacterium]|nr:glycosyltransferase family 4 protein [Chloroflexaceae bacterium]
MDPDNQHPTRPLRVAMLARVVYPLHGFGGIERHVFHLVTHLARLGVAVTLFVQPPLPQPPPARPSSRHGNDQNVSDRKSDQHVASEMVQQSAASLVFLRYDYTSPLLPPNGVIGRQINYPRYTWHLGLAAAAAVRRGSVDLVHSQGLCAAGYGAIRVRDPLLRSVPFVANPHGMEEYRTSDWRKWLAYAPFRLLYTYGHRCADRVIATDACTQHDIPRYLGIDPRRVVVIPSAIDVDECLGLVCDETRAALRARFRLDEAGPVFLSVGRLERNKGYHILIAALSRLREALPPRWRWLLVGQGREEPSLQRQAHEAGLTEHITFVGRLQNDRELHSLYEEVDLVVHPTLYEGSSLVTLEGMVHRRPVIASAVGGIPDKVFHGQNGYLVRPGDVEDLANHLRLALEQRNQWPAWGETGVRIVQTTFAWPVVARTTRALYEELLGNPPDGSFRKGMVSYHPRDEWVIVEKHR